MRNKLKISFVSNIILIVMTVTTNSFAQLNKDCSDSIKEVSALSKPDFIVPKWYDEARYQIHNRFTIGSGTSFDHAKNFYEAAGLIAAMGVKAHTRHIKTGSEGAIWQSSVGNVHPIVAEKGNLAKKLINISHENGLHLICYYRHFEDSWVVEQHPDWQCVDANGKLVTKRGPWVSFATDYPQFLSTRLQELIDMGADGFYFDEIHIPRGGDFSKPSRDLFQQRHGKYMYSATADEIENFRQEVMEETFLKLKKDLVGKKKDIVLLLSGNTVQLKLLHDFYVKWEPHFYAMSPGLRTLPIAATILRDATNGRPTHCWLSPKTPDLPLNDVARYLVYNTIYNRDIDEIELDQTPQVLHTGYKEQIDLTNKFAPCIAGTKPHNNVLIYIDENLIIRKDELADEFVNAFNEFRKQFTSIGTITSSQIKKGMPDACRILCFPTLLEIPDELKKCVADFHAKGGIVLLKDEVSEAKIGEVCQGKLDISVSGDHEDMDVSVYKKSDKEFLVALANGPQKEISIKFSSDFMPIKAYDAISGKSLRILKSKGKSSIYLKGFEVMSAIQIEL